MKKTAPLFVLLVFSFFKFQTSVQAADPPVLTSPANQSEIGDTSPKLSWSWSGDCPASGSCFRVQVDDQSDFGSPYRDYSTSNSTYSPQLSLGAWYWRVEPKDGSNAWSPTFSFTIAQADPGPPNLPPNSNPTFRINEFMPNPANGNEWVEIFNFGTDAFDLKGWKIDDEQGGSSPTTINENSIMQPQEYKVFSIPDKLNNSGDSLRLLKPDGSEFQAVSFGASTKGVSFALDSNGTWQQTLTPTPGEENIINKGEVLSEKTNNQDQSQDNSLPKPDLSLLGDLSASSSSDSVKPVNSKTKALSTNPKDFLPVIFIGLGLIFILIAAVFFLVKAKIIKKPLGKKKAPDSEETSAPTSAPGGN